MPSTSSRTLGWWLSKAYREFGLSVSLARQELQRRGRLFRQAGRRGCRLRTGLAEAADCHDPPDHRRVPGVFHRRRSRGQNAALLLDRLVRQGAALCIHVMLGAQPFRRGLTRSPARRWTDGGAHRLQCNQPDAMLIMDEDNPHRASCRVPGEAIYNDAAGAIESNSPFQIVWLPRMNGYLPRGHRRHAEGSADYRRVRSSSRGMHRPICDENRVLQELLRVPPPSRSCSPRIFLGAPNSSRAH